MKSIGDAGEKIAAKYLKKHQYTIVETNYRVHRIGEIDIIAQEGEYLVFVEVKYRKDTACGRPEEYVGQEKRTRLIRAAREYMVSHRITSPVRFDVVSIVGDMKEPEIEVIQNAFSDR